VAAAAVDPVGAAVGADDAVIPNALVAFGVEFSGPWMAIRYVLSAIFVVALVAFLVELWRERRAR
jgi:hypothetical protein